MPVSSQLLSLVRAQESREVPSPIKALSDEILSRHEHVVKAILFYGSCLRASSNIEGVVDLYVLVDSYEAFYGRPLLTLMNKLLPPNVFYLEVPFDEGTVRAKYAVISLHDFQRSTSRKWFHSYFWGRFAQPAQLAYVDNVQTEQEVYAALAQAILTFIGRALPRVAQEFDALELWAGGLALSYRAELRAEPTGRVAQLLGDNPTYYQQITEAALDLNPGAVSIDRSRQPIRYHAQIPTWQRSLSRFTWAVRQIQGKVLSVLRLMKAAFTFQGGVDYILWKIKRHSGVEIELTSRQRKHPVLTGIGVFWRLYRRGAFR